MKIYIEFLRRAGLVLAVSVLGIGSAGAATTVHSVIIEYDGMPPKIVVLGDELLNAAFTLGGVSIPSSCILFNSTTEQHIDFCTEVGTAVPFEGSFKLEINSALEFSVYAEKAINAPAPPPPPPVNGDCACVTGVSTDGTGIWMQPPIPSDNFVWCPYDAPLPRPYTQQVWISGSFTYASNSYTISALWDPNNPTYDPGNPGNSTSVCALRNDTTGTFTVHHPVSSEEQFDACFEWMIRYGGPCL
ncbi:MAG: hypothetical protein ACU83O_09265 [Gammaproteobacteria bacterium]